MGTTIIYTGEFTSPVDPVKMFKALVLDCDNLIPKLMHQCIKSLEFVEDNGGQGSSKKGGKSKYLKNRFDKKVDEESLTYCYTLMEDDKLSEKKIESFSYDITFESSPADDDEGCKCSIISKAHPKPGVEIKEEELEASNCKRKVRDEFKAVEAYLLSNPQAYA